jgi:uncharacterized membrane protein YczE
MKGKSVFYCEMAYLVGIAVLAFATALMERANLGLSMVVAPAYLVHLKVSEALPFFSFGMAEYGFQAVLLIALTLIMGKGKIGYLLSFATAFFYGLLLDGAIALIGLLPFQGIAWRLVCYGTGLVTCSFAVALLFHTYFPPEAYELFVKELSQKTGLAVGKTKTVYDCCSLLLSVVLSFAFFGKLVGVQWGTLFCALVNGWLIGRISRFLEGKFDFRDALPLREKIG